MREMSSQECEETRISSVTLGILSKARVVELLEENEAIHYLLSKKTLNIEVRELRTIRDRVGRVEGH